MNRRFHFDNPSAWDLLIALHMFLPNIHTLHNHPFFGSSQDFSCLAFIIAGDDHDVIALSYPFAHLQMTSGAKELILTNPPSRTSRAMGPKIRVPLGLFLSSMMTQLLS